MRNGELLNAAEQHGYEMLVTTDQNVRHQQNLADREIAILVLSSTSWPRIQLRIKEIQEATNSMSYGDYIEVLI